MVRQSDRPKMIASARKYDQVVQVGLQQRNSVRFRKHARSPGAALLGEFAR
jgi:hypothetical protein